MTTSAARELAINLSRYLHEDSGYDDLIPDIENALKRCRNEVLEEVAKVECGQYRGTRINSFLTGVESKNMAILALKEAE